MQSMLSLCKEGVKRYAVKEEVQRCTMDVVFVQRWNGQKCSECYLCLKSGEQRYARSACCLFLKDRMDKHAILSKVRRSGGSDG